MAELSPSLTAVIEDDFNFRACSAQIENDPGVEEARPTASRRPSRCQQSLEPDLTKRKAIVWQIERITRTRMSRRADPFHGRAPSQALVESGREVVDQANDGVAKHKLSVGGLRAVAREPHQPVADRLAKYESPLVTRSRGRLK